MNDQVNGIVIRYREYREHDAMLKVLCEDGTIMTIIARGVQKIKSKNAPACQLFTQSRFLLNIHEGSEIQSLRSAEITDSYRSIREDLYRQSVAAYMCECIDQSDFEDDVYPLLKESMDILKHTDQPLRILCLFQSIINRMHGIEPYVDGCVRCGRMDQISAVSVMDGGLVCATCKKSGQDMLKSITQLKKFRLLCKAKLEHYAILKHHAEFCFEDFALLYAFFLEYAGVNVRSYRFLKHLYELEDGKTEG